MWLAASSSEKETSIEGFDSLSWLMLLIFDLDHTLVELGVDWYGAVQNEVMKKFSHLVSDPKAHLVTITNEISEKDKEARLEINRIFGRHEKNALDSGNYKLYNGIKEMLEYLREKGHKTAIATNNNEQTAREFVEKENIKIDFIAGRDSVQRPKPNPEMLYLLMQKAGETRKSTIFLGDGFWDELAGKNANIKTFKIKPGELNKNFIQKAL